MKKYFLFLFAFFAISSIFANIPEFMKNDYEFREYRPEFHQHHNCSHNHSHLGLSDLSNFTEDSYIEKRPYDALSYDVFLDWTNLLSAGQSIEFNGINDISLKIEEDADVVELDIMFLQIDSIFTDNTKLTFNDDYFYVDDKLSIIDRQFKADEIVNYTIYYTYNQNFGRGVYIFKDQANPLVYTQNEPEDARFWMPSNDRPYDKVISSVAIKVPDSYTATSNGFLDSLDESNDSKTYFYSHPHPITTYLMVANASEYVTFRHWYKKVTNPNDSIPIDYFIWEQDYLPEVDTMMNNTRNANFAFRNVSRMIEIMAELLGEYPYEKYGMTAVEPYMFGGMEHQTMTTVHRNWLYGYSGLGILHEVAHQWLGDLITCATWNDIWINEGGATFSEAMFYEKWLNDPYYYNLHIQDKVNRVLDDNTVKEYSMHNLPTNLIFNDGYTLSYYKAGLVYHMLRYWLGDDVFFTTLRNMIEENKFTSMETKDFANYFIENVSDSPINLEKYFEQWVFGVGYPVYDISGTYTTVDDTYSVNLKLEQIQEEFGFLETYEMPIEIILDYSNDLKDTLKLYNDSKTQEYNLELNGLPDDISVHQLSILNTSTFYGLQDVTSVRNSKGTNSYIYPNPLINSRKVHIDSEENIINITLIDELGNVIKETKEKSFIMDNNLSSGIYFIRIETAKGIETQKLMYMK